MPGLICLREKLWTRTYSIGDQVPTCPVFTRAKIKSRFGIFSQFRVTSCIHTFLKILAKWEIHRGSPRIWTRVALCISYDNNNNHMYVCARACVYTCACMCCVHNKFRKIKKLELWWSLIWLLFTSTQIGWNVFRQQYKWLRVKTIIISSSGGARGVMVEVSVV